MANTKVPNEFLEDNLVAAGTIEISGDNESNRLILRGTGGSPNYRWCFDNASDRLRIFREDDSTGEN